ncbi:DUF3231 family protein [Desulfosporosinus youngiae]|uniref:Coat F domain-containing protein n=1 Tax=Desulfosporosinus youngiae DSM 17734 TaxID=768710 RepID=H5XU02_9FIRM|nr:DUF3231 family protein [Desulfosporosinus youngiae]EHQ88960.1 Protein of unknown function (DUF3231) [Desulfosporosinus youngiae DSM 17734]
MKIMRLAEKIGYLGKTSEAKRRMISLGEGYSLWHAMVLRYDSLIETKTLLEFVKDTDLKMIIRKGIKVMEEQKETLEQLAKEFSVPMPQRPPEEPNSVIDLNTMSDRFVFRKIYEGMSNTMFKHITNYQRAHGSYLREIFRTFLDEELDMYDKYYEYGKLKSYLHEPPTFRP